MEWLVLFGVIAAVVAVIVLLAGRVTRRRSAPHVEQPQGVDEDRHGPRHVDVAAIHPRDPDDPGP